MHHLTKSLALLITFTGVAAAEPASEAELPAQPRADAGAGCTWVSAVARPIGVAHFQDPTLQQTAGTLALRRGRDAVRAGTVVATIVGQAADGSLRGNHHFLFADGIFRTKDDRVTLTPTANACVLEAATTIAVVEGTGAFAGLAGTLAGAGTIDVCGAPGWIAISGRLCKR